MTKTDEKQPTFEEQLAQLEGIVGQLERGDVPLDQALAQFQAGVALASQLDQTLKQAEAAVAKVMTPEGELKDFNQDDKSAQ